MGTKEKLIARFQKQPKDFTYQELSRLLKSFGYEEETKGKTSGSRVMFYNKEKEHPILIHKPHPENIIKKYVMKYILQELITIGFIKEKIK
jgi:hypothetical protein